MRLIFIHYMIVPIQLWIPLCTSNHDNGMFMMQMVCFPSKRQMMWSFLFMFACSFVLTAFIYAIFFLFRGLSLSLCVHDDRNFLLAFMLTSYNCVLQCTVAS